MAVFLFDKIIFGPVTSRRLGKSLGINLLPVNTKICNFDCIYCECGLTPTKHNKYHMPDKQVVETKLREKLSEMSQFGDLPDTITFAGNGEPTMHPQFDKIIDSTIKLRNEYCRNAKIAVLSNSTLIQHSKIFDSLKKVDLNILKLDSAIESTVIKINQPKGHFVHSQVIKNLRDFQGKFILQTMFVRGFFNNEYVNNTTHEEIEAWLQVLQSIKPEMIMIYTISRDTPLPGLEKIPFTELTMIADMVQKLGFEVQVSS